MLIGTVMDEITPLQRIVIVERRQRRRWRRWRRRLGVVYN